MDPKKRLVSMVNGSVVLMPSQRSSPGAARVQPESVEVSPGGREDHSRKSEQEIQPDQRSAVHVHATDLEAVRDSGVYQCLTPDEAVELGNSTGQIMLHPLVGGLDPATGWESLELFGKEVLPEFQERDAAADRLPEGQARAWHSREPGPRRGRIRGWPG